LIGKTRFTILATSIILLYIALTLFVSCDSELSEEEWNIEKGYPNGITISPQIVILTPGQNETAALTASLLPGDSSEDAVTWTSVDSSIASVDQNGVVSPEDFGKTIITARTCNGKEATCAVYVLHNSTQYKSFDNAAWPEGFTLTGDSDWVLDDSTHNSGSYSIRSGLIGDSQSTIVSYTVDVPYQLILSTVSFSRKVSSESGYDTLKFISDNGTIMSWSGERDWERYSFSLNLSGGLHTFRWSYSKDAAAASGSDAAWIDDIEFTFAPLD